MADAEIMDLTKVSRNFPKAVSTLQSKENFLDTIEKILQGEADVVQIEGEEGIGKTTLVSQFAKRYPMNTITLFITPVNKQDYHTEIVKLDFCNQLNWLINQRELSSNDEYGSSFLRNCLFQLQRLATRRSVLYFIIVDGLSDIPDEDRQFRDSIIEILPIGSKGFKFIITINTDLPYRPFQSSRNIRSKSFPMPGFNIDEIRKYLMRSDISLDQLNEIVQTCKGIPGRLSSIKRILDDGMEVEELIQLLPDKLPDLFGIEWSKAHPEGVVEKILAIMAHDRRYHTTYEIANMIKADNDEVKTILKNIGFVSLNENTSQVSYISEAFRRFAAEKTNNLKKVSFRQACLRQFSGGCNIDRKAIGG